MISFSRNPKSKRSTFPLYLKRADSTFKESLEICHEKIAYRIFAGFEIGWIFNKEKGILRMTVELSLNTFDSEVMQSKLPVLVDFWGSNCAPCEQLAPIIATLAEKTAGMAKVCKLNVNTSPEIAAKYSIRGEIGRAHV